MVQIFKMIFVLIGMTSLDKKKVTMTFNNDQLIWSGHGGRVHARIQGIGTGVPDPPPSPEKSQKLDFLSILVRIL